MDPMLIIAAIQAGSAIVQAVDPALGGKAQTAIDAGTAIVGAAAKLYAEVKADLSAGDQASIDAALKAAHDEAGVDVDRVLAEIAGDAATG